jgi:glucosyl-dolichyl phosphate glucuronosyltransferase
MKASVIISTFNRAESLSETLASIARSELPESFEWEVVVVDNNSNDQTPEVVERFSRLHPSRFRYLREPHPGKSQALNTAIDNVASEILVFTDDDVIVEPNWLANLTAALDEHQWVGASGRTLLRTSLSIPNWLVIDDRHALAPLAIFDRGSEAIEISESPFGNNMAYRKTMFEKYGYFRHDLGPSVGSKTPQKSEDSEFGVRVLAGGEKLGYEPSAVLHHAIPESRIQKQFFLSWWFDKARADTRAFGTPKTGSLRFIGVPLYLFRRLAGNILRWAFAFGSARRFLRKTRIWWNLGEIKESHVMWRETKQGQISKLEQSGTTHSTR